MTKITWKTEKRLVKDLIPAEYNPRQISETEKRDLMNSIDEFGAVVPAVINLDNKIIGGHQRISIYADLQMEEIDVQVPDRQLTLEEEMRLNIRLNKNTGSWDKTKLSELNMEMLLDVGFHDEDLSDMWDRVDTNEDDFNEKKALEKAKTTNIKPGEMYQLGDHKLLCGNSLEAGDVEKLMGGETVDMIYCDPPYNIGLDYDKGVGNTKGKYGGEHSAKLDSKSDGSYTDFIENTLINILKHTGKGAHVFYWCDERYIWIFQTLYLKNKVENKRVCLWVKNNASPTPQVAFSKVYEPCVYGTIGRPFLNPHFRAFNEILNKEITMGNQVHEEILDMFNIWIAKRDTSYEHPTQKPVRLHEKALKRCTAPGHIVVDLFGGSGSTLIACEQMKRKAFLIEKDPIFCQVIIDRYELFTGKKVKKL